MSGNAARMCKTTLGRCLRLSALALVAALSWLSAAGAVHAQPVKGEATLTPQAGYARLLIKLNEDVPAKVVVAGGILIVQFKKPVDIPIELLGDAVPGYVGAVRRDPDGSAIRMAMAQKLRVNVMTAGERIFVDLLPEKWTGLPPPLPAEIVKELSDRALAAERALRLQKVADEARKRPPVRVRASVQPTFVRFVFAVPDGVAVSSSLMADKFAVSFNSALTFDLADAKIVKPANVASIGQKIDGETSQVEIALIGEVDVRAFREEKTYVVDVGFEQAQKPPQADSSPAIKTNPALAAPQSGKSSENVPPVSEQIAREAALDVKPPEMKAAEVKTADVKAAAPAEPLVAPAEVALQSAPPKAMPEPPIETSMQPPPARKAEQPAKAVQAVSADAGTKAEARLSSDDFRVTFPFGKPTPAAVFRRADTIWLVFDTDKPIDTAAIRREGSAIVADTSLLDLPAGRALRIKLSRPQLATLIGDEAVWTLILGDNAVAPSQQLNADRSMAEPGRSNVSVSLAKPGQLHRITDPDAGDPLLVMTAGGPARGFIKRQDFVEFSLLESIHGVVIQEKADDLTASIASEKLVLSRPGGLTLSTASSSPERASGLIRPIFEIKEWRDYQNAEFLPTLGRLMTAAAQSTGLARLPVHVDLARFYLARGFYPEAKGVLDLALSEVKPGEEDAPSLIVHAVASTLAGRPDIALTDLASPAVSGNVNSQLWKALAYARQEKWSEAREKFKNVEFAVTALPLDLQRIVIADAFRASLEVRDYPGAGVRSNDLDVVGVGAEQAATIALLRGRLAEALGREKDALMSFQAAASSADRPAAADAKIREIALRQKRDEISDDEALTNLETISVTWRGDALEVKALEMMSRLYAAKSRYQEAFAAARLATQLQPNSEPSRKIQDYVAALFEQLYNGSKGDELPPVEALAMFYEFRDLTPIGRRGDEMIRRLADRLVAVDLLDQASELLQYQIDYRLEGSARAQVASRLAMVYLMNRKPDRAIGALRSTRIADLAGELRQQRLLLEARAQTDIGRHDLALDIISNLGGREAIRLRSDIYWAARRWRESAEQIELLYADRWRDFQPLSVVEKGDVIRAAIGYALAEDAIGLVRFREKYNPKMDGGGDRAAFDLAAKPATANSADFARIAKMAATIDTLDGFLREMKTRFPDAVARAKLPPEIKTDPNPTGSLPEIVGLKRARASR